MPFIPAPAGVCRVRVHWAIGQAIAQNVFHINLGTAVEPDDTALLAVSEQVIHSYSPGNDLGPLEQIASDCVMTQIDVVSMSTFDAPGLSRNVSLAGHKTVSGGSSPPGVAVVITMNTNKRGRSNRGRLYQMGIPDNDTQGDGTIVAGPLVAWQSKWDTWLLNMNDDTQIPLDVVVASFFSGTDVNGNAIPRALAVINPVTSVTVRPSVHSQRRRYL